MTTSQEAIVIGALSAFSMTAHALTPEELKQDSLTGAKPGWRNMVRP
jgi:hypothetical protein